MKTETIFDIKFDLHAPENMTEDEISVVVQDIVTFVEENSDSLEDERTLDRFLNHCNERRYFMPLVHEITTQIFAAMYGDEMMKELAERGRAKKPTIN